MLCCISARVTADFVFIYDIMQRSESPVPHVKRCPCTTSWHKMFEFSKSDISRICVRLTSINFVISTEDKTPFALLTLFSSQASAPTSKQTKSKSQLNLPPSQLSDRAHDQLIKVDMKLFSPQTAACISLS